MKITKPVIQSPSDKLTAKAEQALLEKLPVDQKTLTLIGRILEPQNLKRIGIAAIGGSALISLISTLGHDKVYQAAVGREIKKQIAPLEHKLDELRTQNAVLLQQNRELIARLNELQARNQ